MSKINFISLISIYLLSFSLSFSQQQKGDIELQLGGSMLTRTNITYYDELTSYYNPITNQTTYYQEEHNDGVEFYATFILTFGVFMTDNLEWGISPTISLSSPVGRRSVQDTYGGSTFLTYSFLTKGSTSVPYLGSRYYKSDFSNSNDNGALGLNAGNKFYISDKTAFDVNGNYLFSLNSGSSSGILFFQFGISFLL